MLTTLTHYLASKPPGQTVFLLAFAPWLGALTFAFAFRHAMDVASTKVWG